VNIFKKIFITDWLVILYLIFCMIWIAVGKNNIDTPDTLFFKLLSVLSLIIITLILQHYLNNPILKFIRHWYPIMLLGFFYTSTTLMDMVVFKEYLDPSFQYLDLQIFGYHPGVVWGTMFNSFFIQEFFHFAYFSYYPMIFGVPFYIYINKDKFEFNRVLFNILFVFVMCYILYIIFPVVGARIYAGAEEMTETYRHGLFTHIMVYIYRSVPHWGAAFPSSHVAVSLTISLLSFRYFKYLSWILLINTIFLSISTVFCHYHYFVDVLGGIIYGFIMYGVSEFIYILSSHKKDKYADI